MTGTHDLGTRHRILDNGRRMTLRHAVPFDAPRLSRLGSEFDRDDGRVALDDHGRIVGHGGHAAVPIVPFGGPAAVPIVLDDWAGSGLEVLLARLASRQPQRLANEPTFDSMQRRSRS